ncbi:hypothetical protein Tco_1508883 [Tanacetum coccineum]
MLMNQDKNKKKSLNMIHSHESMLTGSRNQLRKGLKNFLNKSGSMNSLMLTKIQGTRASDRVDRNVFQEYEKFPEQRQDHERRSRMSIIRVIEEQVQCNIELEYNMDHCHLVMTDMIDWTNLEGDRFHNDLRHGNKEKKYALSVTKIKASGYEQEAIEELIPHLWSPTIYKYNKNADLGIHHWRDDRQWFYKGSIRHKSPYDVYSKINIISAKRITVEEKYGYGYLKEIVVKRADQKEYTFVEADFPRLNHNDIEDLYLLKIHDKIHNIDGMDEFDLINALQLYIRCFHQKVLYTTLSHPRRVVYIGNYEQKMLMRANELHKFNDETFNKVYNKLDVMLRDNRLTRRLRLDEYSEGSSALLEGE